MRLASFIGADLTHARTREVRSRLSFLIKVIKGGKLSKFLILVA